MPNDMLQSILSKLDRGGAPDAKYPNRKGEYSALCPFHTDSKVGNFSLSERGYNCFACGESGSLRKLARHLGIEVSDNGDGEHSLTLAEYAEAKRLPTDFLQRIGVREAKSKTGRPYIIFSYRDEHGKLTEARFRYGMREKPKGRKGAHPTLYGLWRLPQIRQAGWVLLVEGESDAQTAWLAGLPALGIPGATTWRSEWTQYLDGLAVYVWREPDTGGDALMSRLRPCFPAGRALSAPDGIKDLSAAHLAGQDIAALIEQLKETSVPLSEAQPAAVKAAQTLLELAPWVREQLSESSRRETKMVISETLADWLLGRGRLILDLGQDTYQGGRPYLLVEDHSLWPLEKDHPFTRRTLHDAGLNGTEATFAFVLEHLRMVALKAGQKTHLSRWQERRPNALYVSCDPYQMARINNSGLELVANGTDDVWFAGDATLPAWTPADSVFPLDLPALRPALETQHEVPSYTPEVQRDLLAVWIGMLLSGLRPLPLLVCLGQRGGGKSTLARAILRILLGPDTALTTISNDQRDLEVLLTGLPVVGLDNVDGIPPDWLPDILAAAVTGISVERRQLYTDSNRISRPVTAALMITTRTGGFARADVAERSLPILTGEFSDSRRLSDSDLMSEVDTKRNALLSWAARLAWQLLRRRSEAPAGLPLRFQDFARSVWGYLALQGREDETADMLYALRQAQALTVGEADELAEAIIGHVDVLQELSVTPAELVRELSNAGAEMPHFGGGKAIARRLREIRGTLALAGISLHETKFGNATKFTLRATQSMLIPPGGSGESGECGESGKVAGGRKKVDCENQQGTFQDSPHSHDSPQLEDDPGDVPF